jgi:exopolysaccharide production protein ExoY
MRCPEASLATIISRTSKTIACLTASGAIAPHNSQAPGAAAAAYVGEDSVQIGAGRRNAITTVDSCSLARILKADRNAGMRVSAEMLMQRSVALDEEAPAHNPPGLAKQRAVDLFVAVLAAIVLAPLMLLLAFLTWASDGGPVFFGHLRVGRMGQLFRCWKFRSMVVNSDEVLAEYLANNPDARAEWEACHKLRQDPRITRIGRFLRASSLDELPQLWNVFLGEMSIVGPRPIVIAEIERYRSNFAAYCACRPGITGLWQISGRSDVSYEQRVALDTQYAKSRSLMLDVQIMASTIPAVLARRGSY